MGGQTGKVANLTRFLLAGHCICQGKWGESGSQVCDACRIACGSRVRAAAHVRRRVDERAQVSCMHPHLFAFAASAALRRHETVFFCDGLSAANDPESGKKVAPAVGFFLPLAAYVAYVSVVAASAPRALLGALCLSSHVAGAAGVLHFVEAERNGGGISWAQLGDAREGPSLALVWLFLVGDVLSYMLLATWLVRRGVARTPMPRTQQQQPRRAVVEAVSDALHESVVMRNLGRAFAGRPPVVALANVDLTLYDGQVTALLGQNGAGKT
eukprot:760566-Pleurochrysis_carterae.AAC.1